MEINFKIFEINIMVDAPIEVADWLRHDYSKYLVANGDSADLKFILFLTAFDYNQLPESQAKIYHSHYIVYEKKGLRFIDFFGQGLAIYRTKEEIVEFYCPDKNFLYEIFELAFESLLGEALDKIGFHRIHCLGLAKDGQATILLLPPGAGKTTLALKFLNHPQIKVLTEDIALFKKGRLYGWHSRFSVRQGETNLPGRLIKNCEGIAKILIDTNNFNLAKEAKPANIILGQRVLSPKSEIKKISRTKLFLPLFKSMVLGLELQQSLAYFLLRNYKDGFSKIKIGFGRLLALIILLAQTKSYYFEIGDDIEKNYQTLKHFFNQN